MIIVAGHLQVSPEDRIAYLEGCRVVVELARATPGCQDFALSPDPVDPGRVNVYERWRSVEDVETFRGSGPDGPDGPDAAAILDAHVEQYEIRTATPL